MEGYNQALLEEPLDQLGGQGKQPDDDDGRVTAAEQFVGCAYPLLVGWMGMVGMFFFGATVLVCWFTLAPHGLTEDDIEQLSSPSRRPPYCFMFLSSFVGTMCTIAAIGPPKATSNEPHTTDSKRREDLKEYAKKSYQVLMLFMIVKSVVQTIIEVAEFAKPVMPDKMSTGNMIYFMWKTVMALCLTVATGNAVDDMCNFMALVMVTISHIKFMRAHDVHTQLYIYPGDGAMFRTLVKSKGFIFAVYAAVIWLFFPLFIAFVVIVGAPTCILYFWILGPPICIMWVVVKKVLVPLALRTQTIIPYSTIIRTHVEAKMYGAKMKILAESDFDDFGAAQSVHARNVTNLLRKVLKKEKGANDFERYQNCISHVFSTGMSTSMWQTFLGFSIVAQTLACFVAVAGCRLWNGQKYLPAAEQTLTERTFAAYFSNLVDSVSFTFGSVV